MNIPSFVEKIFSKFRFVRRIRLAQTTVLTGGILVLVLLALVIFAWDAYLFLQSISPPRISSIDQSKRISFTSETIDEGINILDQRKQRFDELLQTITSTTTISF